MALAPDEFKKKREASLDNIRQHWRAEGDELINDGQGLYLTTDKYYGDFELLIDYKTVPRADSGIYLRGVPQVQIWDSTEEGKFGIGANKGSGALWNNSPGAPGKDPLVKADKPFGQWNSFRIIMVGLRVWIWLNGQQTVDGAIMENYWKHRFLERWGDELFRSAYSYIPQSTVGDLLNLAIIRFYKKFCQDYDLVLQLHDAMYVFSGYKDGEVRETMEKMRESMMIPLNYNGEEFMKDTDFSVGKTWGEIEEV